MKKRQIVLAMMAAGLLTTPISALSVQAKQAIGTEDWTVDTDYTKLLISPGADETKLNFSWYSEKVQGEVSRAIGTKAGVQIAKKADMNGTEFPTNAKFFPVEELNEVTTLKNGDSYYINRVDTTGFEENTSYVYRYSSDGVTWSSPQDYKTKDFDRFQVLYVGDPQIGSSGNVQTDVFGSEGGQGWNTTLTAANTRFPNLSYMISVGDQVEKATDILTSGGKQDANKDFEVEWAGFMQPSLLRNLPVQTLVGNHESSGVNLKNHTNVPNESSVGTKAGNDYYYTYGSTLFMVLNTNNSNAADHTVFMDQAVKANPDAKWRVVTFHQDIYGSGAPHSDSDGAEMRKWLAPVVDKFDIDVVLTGHDHAYSRSYQLENGQVLSDQQADEAGRIINPTGTVYMTANSATGSKYYDLIAQQQYYIAERDQKFHPNYSVLNIDDASFSIDTYDVTTGEKVDDTYTIVKSAKYEDLRKLVEKTGDVEESKYTAESYKTYKNAYKTAKALCDGSSALDETTIANAYADLNSAYNNLEIKTVTPTPEQPSTPDVSMPAFTWKDTNTNILLTAKEGVFPKDAKATTQKVTAGEAFQDMNKRINGLLKNVAMYDISFLDANAKSIQPNGSVEITIPLDDMLKGKELGIYTVNGDALESLKYEIKGNNVVFSSNHFSLFAIGEKVKKTTPNPTETKPSVKPDANESVIKDTSAMDSTILFADVIAILGLSGGSLYYAKKKFNWSFYTRK